MHKSISSLAIKPWMTFFILISSTSCGLQRYPFGKAIKAPENSLMMQNLELIDGHRALVLDPEFSLYKIFSNCFFVQEEQIYAEKLDRLGQPNSPPRLVNLEYKDMIVRSRWAFSPEKEGRIIPAECSCMYWRILLRKLDIARGIRSSQSLSSFKIEVFALEPTPKSKFSRWWCISILWSLFGR